MQIIVRQSNDAQHNFWQVHLDQLAVSFRNETEAQHFATTLQTRLQAPHLLPERLAS